MSMDFPRAKPSYKFKCTDCGEPKPAPMSPWYSPNRPDRCEPCKKKNAARQRVLDLERKRVPKRRNA